MTALVSSRHNPIPRVFYDRLRADGKSPKEALVACMRKLLTTLNAIVREQTPWQPASSPLTAKTIADPEGLTPRTRPDPEGPRYASARCR